jgi:large subunit ribosomal protein L1
MLAVSRGIEMLALRSRLAAVSTRRGALSTAAAKKKPDPVTPLAALRQVLAAGGERKRNFDESVDIDLVLSLDPRKPLQAVRGVASLPHGVGRPVVVAAFAETEDEAAAARAAGADVVGGEELIDAVAGGSTAFDVCVSTAALVPALKRRAARVLGPRGLLPSPKNEGTVAADAEGLGQLVAAIKKGRVKLKTEPKRGVLHAPFGRLSFGEEKLEGNLRSLMLALVESKPEKAPKGKYFLKASISSTMGPGVPVDVAALDPASPRFFREEESS